MLTRPDFDHYGEFENFIESGLFIIENFIVNKKMPDQVIITLINRIPRCSASGYPNFLPYFRGDAVGRGVNNGKFVFQLAEIKLV